MNTVVRMLGRVPERPISANPGLNFFSVFVFFPSFVLLRLTFCVIFAVSGIEGSILYARVACS